MNCYGMDRRCFCPRPSCVLGGSQLWRIIATAVYGQELSLLRDLNYYNVFIRILLLASVTDRSTIVILSRARAPGEPVYLSWRPWDLKQGGTAPVVRPPRSPFTFPGVGGIKGLTAPGAWALGSLFAYPVRCATSAPQCPGGRRAAHSSASTGGTHVG